MKLLFEDCIRVERNLYFICRDFNVFCSLNIDSGEIVIIDSIPENSVCSWRLGAKIVYWKDKLYFAPMCADKIWRYDLTNREWKGYERKILDNWTDSKDMFQAVLYKGKIFFIGSFYPAIIILNPETEEMEYVTEPYKNRIEVSKETRDCWFRTDYVLRDNVLYMASCVDNTVLHFNMDNYEFSYLKVGDDDLKYSGIGWDGEYFYLSPRKDGPFLIWDGEKEVKKINVDIDSEKKLAVFGGVMCIDGKVIFLASFSKNTVILSPKENYKTQTTLKQYLLYKRIDDETVASLENNGTLEIVYKGKKYCYNTEISDRIIGSYMKKNMHEKGEELSDIVHETASKTLGLFLNMI